MWKKLGETKFLLWLFHITNKILIFYAPTFKMYPLTFGLFQLFYKGTLKSYYNYALLVDSITMAGCDVRSNLFWDCQYCSTKFQINAEQNASDFIQIIHHLMTHLRNGDSVNCPVCPYATGSYKSFNLHCKMHKLCEQFRVQ